MVGKGGVQLNGRVSVFVNWCVFVVFQEYCTCISAKWFGLLCKEYYLQYSEDFTCAQYFCALICKGKCYVLLFFSQQRHCLKLWLILCVRWCWEILI